MVSGPNFWTWEHKGTKKVVQAFKAFVSAALLCACAVFKITAFAEMPPKEWVDPATGHRVVRLSDESGTASLYFHQNPYTASGDKMVVTTREGLATIHLRYKKNRTARRRPGESSCRRQKNTAGFLHEGWHGVCHAP
jgi:hypothetical protein